MMDNRSNSNSNPPRDPKGIHRTRTCKLKRMKSSQLEGQMHIMEVVTAGLLFLVALNLVANMTVTPTQSSQPLYQVQKLGSDVLRILDTTPTETSGYSSFLDEALTTDNITIIRERIDESLPRTISYNLTLVAIDDYFLPLDAGSGTLGNEVDHGVLVSIDKRSLVLITLGETGEQSATSHRIVYLHDGAVHEAETDEQFKITEGWYDLTLILWFEPRGE